MSLYEKLVNNFFVSLLAINYSALAGLADLSKIEIVGTAYALARAITEIIFARAYSA